jgi:hypothetical protein
MKTELDKKSKRKAKRISNLTDEFEQSTVIDPQTDKSFDDYKDPRKVQYPLHLRKHIIK